MGIDPLLALQEDAARLRQTLTSLSDHAGAARAGLELAKLRFWGGQAQSALGLAQELLPTPIGLGRLGDEIRRWIAAFAYWGPTPVPEGIGLVERLRADMSDPRSLGAIRIARQYGSMLSQQGQFDEARKAFDEEWAILEQLGARVYLASLQGHHMGPAELLAGNAARAAELELAGYELMTAFGYLGFANTVAAHLSRSMLELGRDEEAEHWATLARDMGLEDDPAALGPALGVAARVLARRGEHEAAERLGREAIQEFEDCDYLDQIALAHADLAEVLHLADRNAEAVAELRVALELYERKGHLVGAEKTRGRLGELADPGTGASG
jgi:tetratricopeptide (TPR) repeat protein